MTSKLSSFTQSEKLHRALKRRDFVYIFCIFSYCKKFSTYPHENLYSINSGDDDVYSHRNYYWCQYLLINTFPLGNPKPITTLESFKVVRLSAGIESKLF